MILHNLIKSLHLVAVFVIALMCTISFLVSLLVINCGVDLGGPVTVAMTPKSKGIYTDDNQPQSNPITSVQYPKPLFTHGLSQCVSSGQNAVGSQRSVRKHARGMSKIKKGKGRISKSRLVKFHRQSTNLGAQISNW